MSTFDPSVIALRLTPERLRSYLAACGDDLGRALELYDWNARVGAAFYEDIGRMEVVFRNALDLSLVAHGKAQGWPTAWYERADLFPGRHGRQALEDIATARRRATRGGRAETHGKVVAELSFGFWRYLCIKPYLTSLWVPALASAFANHPEAGDPRRVREDVEDRIQRVQFLRNRVAHHEPIHQRDLQSDRRSLLEVSGWISPDTHAWISGTSRSELVLGERP